MKLVAGIVLVLLAGCGGDDMPVDSAVGDGSRDSTVDATPDSTTGSCTDDATCDDGIFCNGVETCEMGTCAPATDGACGDLDCDESADSCLTDCDVNPDADEDGHDALACGGDDCDDTSPLVYPGAEERPGNGIDEDCDAMELCYADADDDGFRTEDTNASADLECTGVGDASHEVPTFDCDDANPAAYPDAEELVADGVDQSCDGFEACFADIDEDGFRPDDTSVVPSEDLDCFDPGEADGAISTGDCDDTDELRNPAAVEVAGDGVDQDCNSMELCYVDVDGDGYRPDTTSTVTSADLACDAAGEADHLAPSGDCADSDPDRHPGARESCNGLDDSCDGHVDERFGTRRLPPFGFGWAPIARSCGSAVGRCELGVQQCLGGAWEATCTGDVESRTELCDATDDDCDGAVDEGCGCVGGDTRPCGSTVGACTAGTQTCTSSGIWTTCVGGVRSAAETCNGSDDDCDGVADEEDTAGCTEYFVDGDGDGSGDRTVDSRCLCGPEGEYVVADGAWQTDCNDSSGGIHPGATERCDTVDWDCDGRPREQDATGCTDYYRDDDRDSHGAGSARCLCAPTGAYRRTSGGDCCDRDSRVHPGVTSFQSLPNNCGGYDYNCDGRRELNWTDLFGCGMWCGPDDTDEGWITTSDIGAPDCGVPGFWSVLCFPQPFPPFCFQAQTFRFQKCR